MFVEKIKTEGLAHLSYLVGDGGDAAVIDPRRDCEIYLEMARERGTRITHIFETHRNEDLISGAPVLAEITGAPVHHGPNADGEVAYADTVREGDSFDFGTMRLNVLETPGHTDDSLSFAIYDVAFGDEAVGVFTGDALFVGDVGRTDFYPDRAEEVAGLLFDSLKTLVGLGDQAIIYPAHGAGSVCGDGMANREFSTIGYERKFNPAMQIRDREDFIARKVAERHDQPPYFSLMERLNLEGSKAAPRIVTPDALDLTAYDDAADGALLVDVRDISAFLGAHIPDSLSLPADMVPAYAGWLLDPDDDLLLVAEDDDQAETAARHLARIGYDRVKGFLNLSMPEWSANGRAFGSTAIVDAEAVADRLNRKPNRWTLLDVRRRSEIEDGMIEGAAHAFLGTLPDTIEDLDKATRYTVMCASGARATIGASLLLRAGLSDVDVFLGSMGAWRASGHDVK